MRIAKHICLVRKLVGAAILPWSIWKNWPLANSCRRDFGIFLNLKILYLPTEPAVFRRISLYFPKPFQMNRVIDIAYENRLDLNIHKG